MPSSTPDTHPQIRTNNPLNANIPVYIKTPKYYAYYGWGTDYGKNTCHSYVIEIGRASCRERV